MVFLKQLNGLATCELVSGPQVSFFVLNPKEIRHCHLRQTDVKIPEDRIDASFKRSCNKPSHQKDEIFNTEKEKYQVTEECEVY